jgi:hypothetical protein
LPFGEQCFECDTGGLLLCLFLGAAFRFGECSVASEAVGDADFDAEELLVIGTALSSEDVLRLADSSGLEVFLEGGLVIANGSGEGVTGAEGAVQIGKRGLDDVVFDEGSGGVESAVEVEGGDDGFDGVGEESWLVAASALLFAAAEAKECPKADALADVSEVPAADEGGAEAGQLSLAGAGEAAIKAFGYDQA